MNKILVILSALSILSGCTTTRIQSPLTIVDKPGIVFHRESAFYGGGCSFWVKVNGDKVAKVDNGETVFIPLNAGIYTVSVGRLGGICNSDTAIVQRDIEVRDKPVKVRYELQGVGKSMIPFAGIFMPPTPAIVSEDDIN